MRLFILQIHDTSNCHVFDEIYHFEDFNDLCAEYRNKMNYYSAKGYKLCSIEEPTLDEGDNEVGGLFKFLKKTGDVVIGRATDVHIGD
jgi:hypothetical protein